MRLSLLCAASTLIFSSTVCATEVASSASSEGVAVQAAIATGGNISVGLANYTNKTEFGFTISGVVNNADNQTKLFVPVLFGGLRHALAEKTYFAWGLDLVTQFGRIDGDRINSDYQIGPYISIEQALTPHVLLIGWVNPYTYQYTRKAGETTVTQRLLGSGGIGLSYFLF